MNFLTNVFLFGTGMTIGRALFEGAVTSQEILIFYLVVAPVFMLIVHGMIYIWNLMTRQGKS